MHSNPVWSAERGNHAGVGYGSTSAPHGGQRLMYASDAYSGSFSHEQREQGHAHDSGGYQRAARSGQGEGGGGAGSGGWQSSVSYLRMQTGL
jgi:hypothetical protein